MAKTPSPLHTRRIPKSVSKPTETAEAAATVAESVVAPSKSTAKRAARKSKPAATAPVPKATAKAPATVPAKEAKAHKAKLVRDSFTMPKDEYQVIEALKRRALGLERHVRKSELLRAGIQVLNSMSDKALLNALRAVPTLKTGRPKSN